ncbi:hypothetical protein GCM10023185_16670 [Hymenobacter saemangeumensis]|uniref:POTRA domain-containing protein n=2 Tax=Hymenobacter saemangeumensis TaxID=1084522 RepID=A0ABP8IAE5_9BACT
MLTSLLLYLAEASFCLAVFALAYRLLLARLSTFGANRAYLLGSMTASLLLPLLAFPGLSLLFPVAAEPGVGPLPLSWQLAPSVAPAPQAPGAASPDLAALLVPALALIYLLGALAKLWGAGRNVRSLLALARRHPRTNMGGFTIVELPAPSLPAFSFGRLVFLSPLHAGLSARERQLLLQHEQVHVQQRHTADLLFAEALGVLLWFNGLLPYFKTQLKAVHEYLADEAVARTQGSPLGYGELLIKLAASQPPFALAHAFAGKQIFLRIHMLTQPTSTTMQKLRFLLVLPVFAFAWAATACAGSPAADATGPAAVTAAPSAVTGRIGRISWQGNTFLSTAELDQALGLKPGDAYDSAAVARRLSFDPQGQDLTSRYMDNGYLFFSVTPSATRQADGSTDLTFSIVEGRPARIGTLSVSGNRKTSAASVLQLTPLRAGDVFSRAKLLEAQRVLARQGKFNPEKIGINPRPVMRPNQATDLVDIELTVVEL